MLTPRGPHVPPGASFEITLSGVNVLRMKCNWYMDRWKEFTLNLIELLGQSTHLALMNRDSC